MPLDAPVTMAPRIAGGVLLSCRDIHAWSLASTTGAGQPGEEAAGWYLEVTSHNTDMNVAIVGHARLSIADERLHFNRAQLREEFGGEEEVVDAAGRAWVACHVIKWRVQHGVVPSSLVKVCAGNVTRFNCAKQSEDSSPPSCTSRSLQLKSPPITTESPGRR